MDSFGRRLKRARLQRGLSRAGLAEGLGLTFYAVEKWERDISRPRLKRLRRVAELLGMDVATLVEAPVTEAPGDILQRARVQLASAWGVQPERVRIRAEVQSRTKTSSRAGGAESSCEQP